MTMRNHAGYEEATYGEKTSFDQFLDWEGIPVIRNFIVDDVRELSLSPWKRKGGLGRYIILGYPKDSPNAAAYVCEIPPGQSLRPQKHMFEELIFILKGRGATSVWLDKDKKNTFEWQEGSLFSIPLNARHQHFNGQGNKPARYLGFTNAPMVFNLFHSYDFVFHNGYRFLDRYRGEKEHFSGKGTSRAEWLVWESNFIPDIDKLKFHDWSRKGPGATYVQLEFCDNVISGHVTHSPVGAYKKAHRHGPGAYILVLSGKGYTLMWPEGAEMQRYDWAPGSMISPPNMWFHQHFNTGREPIKMLALKAWESRKYRVVDVEQMFTSIRSGGDLIELEDEDPMVRKIFEEELKKEGIPLNMPPVKRRD